MMNFITRFIKLRVWVGEIKIKDQLSPAEAETRAELANLAELKTRR